MANTTVVPNGDGTTTDWTTSSGSTHYVLVNEGTASPNTAKYVTSNNTTDLEYLQLGNMPTDFATATAVTIRTHCNRGGADKTNSVGLCNLVESDESTVITNSVGIGPVVSGWANYDSVMTITGATDKATWDAARVGFVGFNLTATRTLLIAAVDVIITYTATSGAGKRLLLKLM